MKNNRLFVPIITISFVLFLSVILNICMYYKLVNFSNSDNEIMQEQDSDEPCPVKNAEFVGIWENNGTYYAFSNDDYVYKITLGADSKGDIEPERAYIRSCQKGHLDENNNIIFTDRLYLDSDSEEPTQYIYNVYDVEYEDYNTAGDMVTKESSELISVGEQKYVLCDSVDYLLVSDFEPTNACSWDTTDYYLNILDAEGNIICSATTAWVGYDYIGEDNINYVIVQLDSETQQILMQQYEQNHNVAIQVDFTGDVIYSGLLGDLEPYEYGDIKYFNEIVFRSDLLPDNFSIIIQHLK